MGVFLLFVWFLMGILNRYPTQRPDHPDGLSPFLPLPLVSEDSPTTKLISRPYPVTGVIQSTL